MSQSSILQGPVTGLVAVASLSLLATVASASERPSAPSTWHPWFEIGGYHNSRDDDSTGTSGTNRGETTIFAPIRGGQRTLLFSQITAKFFDDSAKEGNFALGYRRITTSGFNLGAWIGGDVRRTDIDNTFWQLSGGFEALSKNIDARVNWYGPVTGPQSGVAGFAQVHLQGNQIFMTGGEEVGLKGVDGEIGFRLPTEALRLDPNLFELRAYAGGYYFDNDKAHEAIKGVKGRLELRVNDVIPSMPGSRLTAEYEISHDDVRDTRHDVGLRIRIPLNGSKPAPALASLSHQQRRMLDGIERDTDIITGRSKAEAVEDALTGTAFDRVAYATTEVTTTSNTAGDNTLIILNGEVTGAQQLQANQTLQGGGSTIQVRGRKSGTAVPFTAPGAAARLVAQADDEDILTLLGSNTHVAGIAIVGHGANVDDGNGIVMNEDDMIVYLSNLKISDIGYNGIEVGSTVYSDSAHNITLNMNGVTIRDSIHGLYVNGDGHKLYITNSKFIDLRDYSVGINDDNVDATITRSAFLFTGTLGDSTDDGISVNYGSTLTISDITVYGLRSFLYLSGDGNVVTITNATFSEIDRAVFDFGYVDNTLTVTNSVFENVAKDSRYGVFDIAEPDNDLRIANNIFRGTIPGGIFTIDDPTEFLDGSTGNDNQAGATLCQRDSASVTITGEVTFVDGTSVDDATCTVIP